ncbi:MAG: hypothetical protein IJW81_07850 [Clostridia bacterium]|nr:hypothetical protein [Clostridia bacterium]
MMKIEAKNLKHSPALVFFLLMGIRSVYSLSVILPRTDFGWDTLGSILTGLMPLVIAAALFFRIPNLLYLPFGTDIAVALCWLIVGFARMLSAGVVHTTDLLLLLGYFLQIAQFGVLMWMTVRFGKMKMLWFLPLLLYLAYSIVYRIYIFVLVGGGALNFSLFYDLILTVPAYGFLGYWLAHPYKRSDLLKIQNSSEREENNNA